MTRKQLNKLQNELDNLNNTILHKTDKLLSLKPGTQSWNRLNNEITPLVERANELLILGDGAVW